jgi:hypothetical protein
MTPERGDFAQATCSTPEGPRLRLWVQPTGDRKPHGQPAVPWNHAPHLQRPSCSARTNSDGCRGACRDELGACLPTAASETRAQPAPLAASEVWQVGRGSSPLDYLSKYIF